MKIVLRLAPLLLLAIVSVAFAAESGDAPAKSQTAALVSKAKASNWVIINRIVLPGGDSAKITGVYVAPAARKMPRFNREIKWGRNLLSEPIEPGAWRALYVSEKKASAYDLKIVFSENDENKQPMAYYSEGAVFYGKGSLLHMSIKDTNDGSCPWKIAKEIDENFGL